MYIIMPSINREFCYLFSDPCIFLSFPFLVLLYWLEFAVLCWIRVVGVGLLALSLVLCEKQSVLIRGLNTPFKRQSWQSVLKTMTRFYAGLQETHFTYNNISWLEVKRWKKDKSCQHESKGSRSGCINIR